MRLEWESVGGEPGIAVNAEQRTSCRPGVRNEMRTQLRQMKREAADELHGRFHGELLIPSLVLGKPLAIIVTFQLAQEVKQFWAENGCLWHRSHSQFSCTAFI